MDRHPDQAFVLDHIAKPRIREGALSPRRERMLELAKRENIYCKLSGMATAAERTNSKYAGLEPDFDAVLEAFGPRRLMFGSDWPVLLPGRDICGVGGSIRSGTAIEAYRLQERMTRMKTSLLLLAVPALFAGDASTTLWSTHPADRWENALPLGNGRLGAMVHGRTDIEQIGLNESTYWSGGPYSTVVPGGREALGEVRRLVFAGEYRKAHVLFGRKLMGYPVEQQKYQALGNLVLKFTAAGAVSNYRHELDLDRAIATTTYEQNGVRFTRTVLVSAVDQVIVVRLTADRPGQIAFIAQLRGYRNSAHSNYATDYFRMDGDGAAGLALRGRSADYMGIAGRVRYVAKLRALAEGGSVRVEDDSLMVRSADAVTLVIAAATNFVSYKDVSGDAEARVRDALARALPRPYAAMEADHVRDHQRLFRRVSLRLPETADSQRPTGERLKSDDPALAALLFQFGRYLLIASSRPGSQPANLQGLWNASMNPSWDSKYTTNINLQMNYWPAETANLTETAEPLFEMIREVSEPGSEVARENYGARGWVLHQNTDLWRAAAPWTVRVGGRLPPAGRGSRCTCGSTSSSPATSRSCAGITRC